MSTKRRIKKLRKIVVGDETYHWLMSDWNCDGDGSCRLTIFKGKIRWIEELINPAELAITPRDIRERIQAKR